MRFLKIAFYMFVALILLGLLLEAPEDEQAQASAATAPEAQLDPEPTVAETAEEPPHADLALGEFARLRERRREQTVVDLVSFHDIPADKLPAFLACMEHYAFDKSPDLVTSAVFDWCLAEYRRDDPDFRQHLPEISIGDRSISAGVECRIRVTNALVSPGSADFAMMSEQQLRYPGQRYLVAGHVDSQNRLGALLRSYYRCELTYDPEAGGATDGAAWTVHSVEIEGG